jgi:hypothetical protein
MWPFFCLPYFSRKINITTPPTMERAWDAQPSPRLVRARERETPFVKLRKLEQLWYLLALISIAEVHHARTYRVLHPCVH